MVDIYSSNFANLSSSASTATRICSALSLAKKLLTKWSGRNLYATLHKYTRLFFCIEIWSTLLFCHNFFWQALEWKVCCCHSATVTQFFYVPTYIYLYIIFVLHCSLYRSIPSAFVFFLIFAQQLQRLCVTWPSAKLRVRPLQLLNVWQI